MLNFTLQKKRIMKFFKGNKLYSILTGVCPVCHKSNMYRNSNPFILSDIFKMHDVCSHCGTRFKIEPAFFYGAMYVSYGVGVALAIASFLITHLVLEWGKFASLLVIIGVLILAFPWIIRISRNIWINLFLKYDSKKAE